jgi:hyaluronan synthase
VLLPIRLFGFFRMAHNAGWGTRDDSFKGDRQRSLKVAIPYLIGFLLLYGAVRMSV